MGILNYLPALVTLLMNELFLRTRWTLGLLIKAPFWSREVENVARDGAGSEHGPVAGRQGGLPASAGAAPEWERRPRGRRVTVAWARPVPPRCWDAALLAPRGESAVSASPPRASPGGAGTGRRPLTDSECRVWILLVC